METESCINSTITLPPCGRSRACDRQGWENGQDRNISTNTSLEFDFITAVVVGDTADKNGGRGRIALYGGDATNGALKEMYDGIRPEKPGYVPMQKQGSLILAIGGDNSDHVSQCWHAWDAGYR
jgi:hypothetical protein